MNTQIINLIPPIDGVQYGYNSDEIKEGDFYYLESVTTKNMILKASESKISSNCKKILFSNNPKDTRFPYLQLPSSLTLKNGILHEQELGFKFMMENAFDKYKSKLGNIDDLKEDLVRAFNKTKQLLNSEMPSKEQEVERLADEYYKINGGAYTMGLREAYIDGFNANKGIYTQEQMLTFGNICAIKLDVDNDTLLKEYLQSLSPTPKAVRVEMEENNCDGCKAGIPVDEYNYHRMGKGIYPDFMICQKYKYNKIKVETSPEFTQGIVKALEVIY